MARPRAIDLFCGAGGMSLGFEQAGFDIVLGVDRDPYHCAAHERNFPYGKTLCASVTDLTADYIRRECGIGDDIDIVFGGPPCQGFSMMGKRDLGDPRSSLVGEFVRLVKELKPKSFVMENVPGMQLGKTRSYFDFVVESLTEAGYVINLPAQTLVASDFGAPQRRERLFVMGIRDDLHRMPKYPEGPLLEQAFAKNIAEAFGGLPNIDGNEELFSSDALPSTPSTTELPRYSKILAGLAEDPTDLSYPRKVTGDLIFGNKRTRHSDASISLYTATAQGEMVPGHKLPRLALEGLSPTLRAGSESERGSHTAPRPIHPTLPRCITVREAARLHGYPDWFAFYPVIHHGFRQVGNSVSPLVARAVGYSIADALQIPMNARKPRGTLTLEHEFPLAEDRKKREKRISHVDELPKVINHLFQERFDQPTNTLLKQGFTLSDIAEAITQSGANMPRIRPESFISELSRTRNAKQILALPLRFGFSVEATPEGGRFVEKDCDTAIGKTLYVSFSSAEIKECIHLEGSFRTANSVDKSFAMMASDEFVGAVGNVERAKDLFDDVARDRQVIAIRTVKELLKGAFWKTRTKLIRYDVIKKVAEENEVDVVILSIPLTKQHEGIVAFRIVRHDVIQRYKRVFFMHEN